MLNHEIEEEISEHVWDPLQQQMGPTNDDEGEPG